MGSVMRAKESVGLAVEASEGGVRRERRKSISDRDKDEGEEDIEEEKIAPHTVDDELTDTLGCWLENRLQNITDRKKGDRGGERGRARTISDSDPTRSEGKEEGKEGREGRVDAKDGVSGKEAAEVEDEEGCLAALEASFVSGSQPDMDGDDDEVGDSPHGPHCISHLLCLSYRLVVLSYYCHSSSLHVTHLAPASSFLNFLSSSSSLYFLSYSSPFISYLLLPPFIFPLHFLSFSSISSGGRR